MAEIAGLVLSVVPIIAATLQQYGTVYKLCKRFQKCKSGIEELLNCLHLQRVIFKNETRFLLIAAVGPEQATAMTQDLGHPSWSDPAIEARLDSILGDSKEALTMAAQRALDKMKRFEEDVQKLDAGDANATNGSKEWRKALRGQFKFTFSEARLTELANSIRRATKDYRVLRAQVQNVQSFTPDADSDTRTSEEIDRIQAIQAAAKRVYEVLTTACKLHTKHHARLSLNPIYALSTMGTEIKFQIAYRHLAQTQVQDRRDVLWFVVESISGGNISPTLVPTQLQATPYSPKTSSKRPASPILKTLQRSGGSQIKRVRIRSPSPPAPVSSSSAPAASQSAPVNLPDLGTMNDFCTQLRACFNKNHGNGTCIGWLENSARWKHRVYHSLGPSRPTTQSQDDANTLASLLTSLASNRNRDHSLSILQRIRLAKLLSTAMLNFNATPWMPSSWSSQDIVLYNMPTKKKDRAKEPDVFVEVPVREQAGITLNQPGSFDSLAPFVRNSTLFSLGVLLLEIAYEAPLQAMREASDSTPGYPAATADLKTAFRQSLEVATTGLGNKYSDIVTKCLYCDFGQGPDLSNPGLQNAIHREVVSELGRLEAGFQQLGIT